MGVNDRLRRIEETTNDPASEWAYRDFEADFLAADPPARAIVDRMAEIVGHRDTERLAFGPRLRSNSVRRWKEPAGTASEIERLGAELRNRLDRYSRDTQRPIPGHRMIKIRKVNRTPHEVNT